MREEGKGRATHSGAVFWKVTLTCHRSSLHPARLEVVSIRLYKVDRMGAEIPQLGHYCGTDICAHTTVYMGIIAYQCACL